MLGFPASRVNPNKATSSNFMPSGVWRGKVVTVHDDATVDLIVPRLSGVNSSYRQIEVLGANGTRALEVGQVVYVAFAEGNPSDLVVLGPVRRPSYVSSDVVVVDPVVPLEEYTASRSGVFEAINGFYQPIRQPTIFTEIIATLRTEGSEGTLVAVWIGSAIIGYLYIPPHTATASTNIYVPALANELINFQVAIAGAGTETLFMALRGNLVDPLDALDPIDEYAFGLGGSLTTGFSIQYPAKRDTVLYEIYATLGTVGSSDTVFKVWAHDAEEDWADYVIGEVTVSAGSPFSVLTITSPIDKWTQLSVEVTSVGTVAQNLGVFVRGRRGS